MAELPFQHDKMGILQNLGKIIPRGKTIFKKLFYLLFKKSRVYMYFNNFILKS